MFHEIVSPDIHVDIYIIPPSPERNYYILMTHGMGAHAMNVPEDLAGQKLERAELFICLPPDWKVGEEGEAWYWPIRWLKILARLPINEDSWLGWGHTIANPDGSPFAENTRFNGIMLVNPGAFPQEASVCPLSGGDEVNFYQLLPLYQEEMDFKLSHSAGELLDLFPEEDLETVDVDRPSVLSDRPQKEFAIPQRELRHLYDGEGPQGCFATDRILVDGCRVGYCYREEPEEGDENWDSGWRFTAGDESDSYMDDPGRSGIYHLNTLCNYDPDIIPLLDSEPGTAWCRDQSGVFRPELYQPDEECRDCKEDLLVCTPAPAVPSAPARRGAGTCPGTVPCGTRSSLTGFWSATGQRKTTTFFVTSAAIESAGYCRWPPPEGDRGVLPIHAPSKAGSGFLCGTEEGGRCGGAGPAE